VLLLVELAEAPRAIRLLASAETILSDERWGMQRLCRSVVLDVCNAVAIRKTTLGGQLTERKLPV
jgi:hypothetical protein